ncbi:MAG: hypothetical protein ACI9BV_003454 [Rhodothermales bacterium]|jgi:hypothetical protein
MSWSYEVPGLGASRNGTDGDVFYSAYWYPQIAVYDDIQGWKADQYFGNGEFYMGYATYDVCLTVPQPWILDATGVLQNPEAVRSNQTLVRTEAARANPEYIVRVVDEEDRYRATVPSKTCPGCRPSAPGRSRNLTPIG